MYAGFKNYDKETDCYTDYHFRHTAAAAVDVLGMAVNA